MRVGDEVERELGLGADRVETRRIEDHEALRQQRMREVDDGVTPHRDLDHAVGVDERAVVRVVGVVQPVALRVRDRDALDEADLTERIEHAVARRGVERMDLPLVGQRSIVGGGRMHGPRLDRQQADRRWQRLVVQQLGGTHRRAPRRRRQDALAVVGEEDGVDELRLAARELGDESDRQPVLAELRDQPRDPRFGFAVQQLRVAQPAAIALDGPRQLEAPGAVFLKFLDEAVHGGRDTTCEEGRIRSTPTEPPGDAVWTGREAGQHKAVASHGIARNEG